MIGKDKLLNPLQRAEFLRRFEGRAQDKSMLPESIKAKLAQADKFDHPDFIDLIEELAKDKDKRFLYFTRDLYKNHETKRLCGSEVLDKILKLQSLDNVILLNYKNMDFAPTPPPLTLLMAFLNEVEGEVLVSVNGIFSVAEISDKSVTLKSLGDKKDAVELDHFKFINAWGKNNFGFLGVVESKTWDSVRYLFSGLNRSGLFEDRSVFDYLVNDSSLNLALDRFFVGQKVMKCDACKNYTIVDFYDTVKAFCSKCYTKNTNFKIIR